MYLLSQSSFGASSWIILRRGRAIMPFGSVTCYIMQHSTGDNTALQALKTLMDEAAVPSIICCTQICCENILR
jgi:hypothetical protein